MKLRIREKRNYFSERMRNDKEEKPPYDNILANVRPNSVYRAVARSILERSLEHIKNENLRKRLLARADVTEPIVGDTFYIMYSYVPILKKPQQISNSILKEMRNVFQEFMKTDKYRALRSITRLNREASMVYTLRFSKVFLEELAKRLPPEDWPDNPPPPGPTRCPPGMICDGPPSGGQQPQPQPGDRPGSEQGQGQQKPQQEQGQGQKPEQKPINKEQLEEAVREALEKAKEEAEKAVETYSNLGSLTQGFTPARLAFLDEEPDINVVEFREMLQILGSLRKAMPLMFTQYKKASPLGFPEGYNITNKPEKAIPRELALPDELFLMKLLGGKFITREKKVNIRGVMIVLLDRSGSMGGYKMAWAKAVAYALALKAMREKMDWVVIPFDYIPHEPITLQQADMLLKVSAGGGTDIGKAILKGLEHAEEKGYRKANIVVITDGADYNVKRYENKIVEKATKLNASIKVIYLQGDNDILRRIANKTKGQLLNVKPNNKNAIRVISVA